MTEQEFSNLCSIVTFALAESMMKAGVALGLPDEVAKQLTRRTISGAAYMLHYSDKSPKELREQVTSPNGTTQAAMDILMGENGLQQLINKITIDVNTFN